ncbi:hypothetical protein RhiirC2_788579 [Rhizophagus irregularis]|uniref:Uncharacterized protein n=1 Tax=Rhizophagus irregularis TaxID=588596 RepID=A0A2N1MPV6_9GLOM|nr:hypothetical protein RhiirC2_788579 [Rhizophagus irregularis]
MDDVTWLTESKHTLERILNIADEFNKMNNIQTNYEKFAMTTNEEIQTVDGKINIDFGSEIRKNRLESWGIEYKSQLTI